MGVKSNRLEGRGGSQLTQLIRSIGYNRDVDIRFGTITAPPPNIKLKIDGVNIEYDREDIVVAEHLTEHERTMTIKSGSTKETYIIDSNLIVGSRVIVATINDGQLHVILDRAVTY